MKKKVLETLLVIWIVITLLMLDFVTLATGISYAWDNTNSENIEFASYFEFENGEKVYSIEKAINSQDINLCMDIEVRNAGYLDGKIELLDKNFKFKKEQIEGANNITDSGIILSQINAGEKLHIEIGLEPNFGERIDKASLNMDNKIALKGIYKNAQGKEKNVEVIKNVKIELTSPYAEENEGVKLESQVITNKVYEINGERKKVLQILVKSGLEGDGYPIKQTNIEIEVPEGVEKIEVEDRETIATNGKKEGEFEYKQDGNKTEVNIVNEEIDGKISYVKQGQDTIIATYIYSEEKELISQDIKVKNTIELYYEKGTKIGKENVIKIEEEKDEIIGYEIKNKQEIYKGKMYSKEGQEYQSASKIDIRYPSIEKNIKITEGKANYTDVVYKKSYIDKTELLKVIGDKGELLIKKLDGTEIKKITKETEDENGKIVVNYEENQNEIIIEINNAEKTGLITIKHEKEIRTESNSREEIIAISEIDVEGILAQTDNINERKIISKINLKESQTKAEIEINKKELSTEVKNENVEIKVNLLTNNAKYDLYKNPSIEVEFPKEIEKIDAHSINLMYGEGMEIKEAGLYKNEEGKSIIKITMEGEQKKHTIGDIVEGTSIIINCNLTVNDLEESKNENIIVKYTNENATQYDNNGTAQIEIKYVVPEKVEEQKETQQVQVVGTTENVSETEQASPIIITKSISAGNGKDIYERQIQRYTLTIKNNTNSDIANITIKDSIPGEMIFATRNLGNGYAANYQEDETVKEFSKQIELLKAGENVTLEYFVRVKQSTEIQGKTVGTKAQAQTEGSEEIYQSNLVENTIKESKFQSDLLVLENPDAAPYIKNEYINYIIKIKNITNETQNNLIITDKIPEGLKYVQSSYVKYYEEMENYFELEEEDGIELNNGYNEETKTVTWNIQSLEAGKETVVKVKCSLETDIEGIIDFINIASVKADGTPEYPSSELIVQYENAKLTIEKKTNLENNELYEEDEFKYIIEVSNETTVESVSGSMIDTLPEGLSGKEIKYWNNDGEENTTTIADEAKVDFVLEPGQTLTIEITVVADKLPEGTEELEIRNIATISGRNMSETTSNEIVNVIKKKPADNPDNPDNPNNPDNPDNPNNPNNPDNPSGEDKSKYSISGIAWLDENGNGSRDSNEGILQGITVILLDKNGEKIDIETITDKNGIYKFENLEKGKYIVAFKYDSNNYRITQYQKEGISGNLNNDVVKTELGENITVGLTDIINIVDEDISNIDIGLVRNEKFDLKLEKSITRIVAQNNKTTEVREYNDTNLAKIDIDRKTINGTNIIIEYKIKITNEGEVPGYAKKIVDYMPKELEFSSELNKDWYLTGENLISTSLSENIINPGETKTLSLVLTKNLTEDNIGTITNTAEIQEDYNENIINDIDSVPGNKKTNEDDISTVSAIISIKTGRQALYIALSISVMLTLSIGIYLINKKVLSK